MAIQTFETVKELGLVMPGVVNATAYGAPALKLSGKLVACIPVNKSAEANSLAVRIDLEHRAALLSQRPDTYYITDHYAPHPTVLVRLSKISRTELKEILREACRFVSCSAFNADRPTRRSKRAAARKRPRNVVSDAE